MDRIRKLRLAGLLLGVTLLAGACDHQSQASRTPDRASTTILPTPTTATLDKPCLHDVKPARPF